MMALADKDFKTAIRSSLVIFLNERSKRNENFKK